MSTGTVVQEYKYACGTVGLRLTAFCSRFMCVCVYVCVCVSVYNTMLLSEIVVEYPSPLVLDLAWSFLGEP